MASPALQALNSVAGTLENAEGLVGDGYLLWKPSAPCVLSSLLSGPLGLKLCVDKESSCHCMYEGTQLGVGSIEHCIQKDSVQPRGLGSVHLESGRSHPLD